MSEQKELRHRVEAKKHELQKRIAELKADATATADDTAKALEKRLDELNAYLRDGWDDLGENVARKLNDWLKRSDKAA